VNAAEELRFASEVKQQADRDAGATEVVEELTLRIRSEHLGRLHFDDAFADSFGGTPNFPLAVAVTSVNRQPLLGLPEVFGPSLR